MVKKKENLFSKIFMITFLVLIVLGFTIPGFLNSGVNNEATTLVEERICQSDADCYLECAGQPISTICSLNLCLRNSCEEPDYFPYTKEPITFNLEVVDLELSGNSNDFFVLFEDKQVQSFGKDLTLNLILSKAGVVLYNGCLLYGNEQNCGEDRQVLQVLVNGEEEVALGNYVPENEDDVKVVFG